MTPTVSDSLKLMPEELIGSIPRLYAQDGQGMDAMVYVHLFGPVGDWYITEVDEQGETAFGYSKLSSFENGELGYISISELQELVDEKFIEEKNLKFMIERNLYFTPRKLKEVMDK